MNDEAKSFVLEWYSYLLTLSLITDKSYDETIADHCVSVFRAFTDVPPSGVLFGCAYDLFSLIPSATNVCKRVYAEMAADGGQISPDTDKARADMLEYVMCWKPDCDHVETATAGRLYQLALSVLLRTDSWAPDVQELLNQVPGLLDLVPAECSVTTTLCWPLSVIGSVAQADFCRSSIREYMVKMAGWYKFANIRQMLELLDELWKMSDLPPYTGGLTVQYMMQRNDNYFILA